MLLTRSVALFALAAVAAAQNPPQGPPPQTTPVQRGSGWAEPWQARWKLTPMLEVNLATGNLVCAISTGRFYKEGLAPHHEVALFHNSQRADVSGDFTGGFDLGDGWSSNFGVTLSFPTSTEAELVLGDGNLERKLTVRAQKFTKSAAEKIKAAGGSVVLLDGKGREITEAEAGA